ncbi:hypothetical protein RDWZM_008038 [Blomia tropicalis]|uniref:Uncharacterized protein n=1 Tax=Blomia tropicalis TaxID=40697 RepID=A0A9Q0RL13_BLOTA|nr:hypothetical protein RDWZM_008038 [Blomia tropicalis]
MEGNFEESQEWIPKYSSFEQESIDIIESLPDSDHELEIEKCNYDRKLWNYFQNCALAIAQLYRDNMTMQNNLWNSFQQASTNVACLYKECSEFQKKLYDNNYQYGYHKRTKELLTWAKKKKNHIHRDELIAFLSSRPMNHVHGNYFHHRLSRNSRSNRNNEEIRFLNASPPSTKGNSRLHFSDTISDNRLETNLGGELEDEDTNLKAFREAIAVSGVRNSNNMLNSNIRRSPRNNIEDLSEFINQEYHRHVESRKRTSSMDVCMDSPTHNKRTKFC